MTLSVGGNISLNIQTQLPSKRRGLPGKLDRMGCNESKLPSQKDQIVSPAHQSSMAATHTPSDAAAVADTADGCVLPRIAVVKKAPQPSSCIQDLPPLLLAYIFSKYLSWEDIQGPIALVCQSWRQIAAEVTPQQLSFEFDLVEDASLPTDSSRSEGKSLLQMLLSQPSKLLQRLTGQLRPQQQGDADADDQDPHTQQQQEEEDQDSTAEQLLQQQQFLQYLQNVPWQRWLHQHGMQLQDFSMSITNLDSNCAAAQCQLKETLLRALADSATLKPLSSSSSSTSVGSTPRASDSGSEASTSAPNTPLSSSCSEFSLSCSAADSSSAASCTSSTSTSSSTSSLQLRSLHLKVPLFECDVLLLAHGVCAKAPELRALSLVGYSSSGAVKTRPATSLPSSAKSSRHRLPINRPAAGRNSSGAASLAAAAAAAAAAAGGSAARRGNDLIPVGYANSSSPGSSTPPWTPSPSSGWGAFITGSSLKQLMASVPQLESLTFACRQLYKLNWLAPATQLTYLSLRDCSLGGDLVKQLAALNLPKLRAVDLSGSKGLGGAATEQHLQQLTRIAGGRLEQVDLSGWDLAGAVVGSSRELPHLGGLRSLGVLKLECCGLKGWGVQPGQLPSLTHLSLSGNPLDSRGMAAACGMSQLCSLELAHVSPKELALLPQQQPGPGPACWSGMRPIPHLTSLNLTGNFWPDNLLPDRSPVLAYRAFKHNLCSSIAAMPRLAHANLTGCKTPYYKTTHLLASLPPSVTQLVLDGAVEGLKTADVQALQQLPKLRVLSACGCNVRDKHVAVLCGLTGLRSLLLRDNALGPEGLADLVEGCPWLTLLDVVGNDRVGGKAGAAVCGAAGSPGSTSHLLLLRD